MNGTKKEVFYIGRIETQTALMWMVGFNTKVKGTTDPFLNRNSERITHPAAGGIAGFFNWQPA